MSKLVNHKDSQLASLAAERDELRRALEVAHEAIEEINSDWASPSKSAAMGHIAAICVVASAKIEVALSSTPGDDKALERVRREAQIEALESVGCTCAISPKNPLFQSHFEWCPMQRAAELRKEGE